MKDKISVIIPAFNSEKWIQNCIDGVLKQNDDNFEIIIINDGSTDNTINVCQRYKNDNRIIILDKNNAGVSVARNEGTKIATGKWVVYLDSDDCLSDKAFLHLRKIENENPDLDIIVFNYIVKNKSNKEEFSFLNESIGLYTENKEDIIISCLSNKIAGNADAPINIGVPWGKVYRRQFLLENNLIFPKGISHMEDTIFNIYAFKKAKNIYFYDRAFYIYSINSESVTNQYVKDFDQKAEIIFNLFEYALKDVKTPRITECMEYKGLCLYTQFLQMDCFNKKNRCSFANRLKRSLQAGKKSYFPKTKLHIYKWMSNYEKLTYLAVKLNNPLLIYVLYKKRIKNLNRKGCI